MKMTEGTASEQKRILQMVAEGKITAEEGAKLIQVVTDSERAVSGTQRVGSGAKFIRIRVYDGRTGRAKVNVNVPLALAELALKFIPSEYEVDAKQVLAAIRSSGTGKILEAEDDASEQRVEIVIE